MTVAAPVDVRLILEHQDPAGAYPASPSFSQYPHAWLRDGSFVAYAMDRAGLHESAARFHTWVARTVLRYEDHVETSITASHRGEAPEEFDFLPARFGVDGSWRRDGWPNFQLDGYGHWLWSLAEHRRLAPGREDTHALDRAAALVGRYLVAFWHEPCYDAWEEYRSQLHTATLASLHAGIATLQDAASVPGAADAVAAIHATITNECVVAGRFVKHIGNPAVDASLLWLATPFGVLPEHDARVRATVEEIERTLVVDGGVTRYAADTFYGGGAWILLTAWLGWYHARAGDRSRARACLAWIERQRDADGALPEQVPTSRTNERFLRHWTTRWGASAKPLLWSHAMALVLRLELAGD
ncbi:MAG: glycoside hydrolase family 15 protein [Trueperaceae bacterium]|nr:glycoside hydrolase family 15 protein [Trueperaceae bacterium]